MILPYETNKNPYKDKIKKINAMKNRPISKLLLSGIIVISFLIPAQAQFDNLGTLIPYQENAEILLKEYIRPYTNALGTDLSSGWYNTAKPHKTLGFDITFTLNTTFVPDAHKHFNPQELGLTDITTTATSSPTAMGDNNPGAVLIYEDDFGVLSEPEEVAKFKLPKGTGMGIAPAPMLQVGVGLVKGTEIMGRYVPDMQFKNQAEIGMWGLGVKHSIKQWIPAINKLPILHLSIMAGYTRLNSQTGLNFMPKSYVDEGIVDKNDVEGYDPVSESYNNAFYNNQKMILEMSSFTTNLLVSANLPVVCFYGGVGFNTVNTNLALNGNYPMIGLDGVTPVVSQDDAVKDPVDMQIKHQGGNTTNPRYNIGVRFKFAVITLHFDYTYADYSVASGGLGISFR